MHRLIKLIRDERGVAAVEYSLILAMIFLAMIVGVQNFATETTDMWNSISEEVSGA